MQASLIINWLELLATGAGSDVCGVILSYLLESLITAVARALVLCCLPRPSGEWIAKCTAWDHLLVNEKGGNISCIKHAILILKKVENKGK